MPRGSRGRGRGRVRYGSRHAIRLDAEAPEIPQMNLPDQALPLQEPEAAPPKTNLPLQEPDAAPPQINLPEPLQEPEAAALQAVQDALAADELHQAGLGALDMEDYDIEDLLADSYDLFPEESPVVVAPDELGAGQLPNEYHVEDNDLGAYMAYLNSLAAGQPVVGAQDQLDAAGQPGALGAPVQLGPVESPIQNFAYDLHGNDNANIGLLGAEQLVEVQPGVVGAPDQLGPVQGLLSVVDYWIDGNINPSVNFDFAAVQMNAGQPVEEDEFDADNFFNYALAAEQIDADQPVGAGLPDH